MTVKTFAAIDVGSFELELGIFEISASAGIREIDHVRHALALGKDTYNDGRLSHEIVEEMCEVLNKFRFHHGCSESCADRRLCEQRASGGAEQPDGTGPDSGAYRTPGPHDEQLGASF